MEYTASNFIDLTDLDQWSELISAEDGLNENRSHKKKEKKRRRPLRKNRKPARPVNYIGQRTNNRLLKICQKG